MKVVLTRDARELGNRVAENAGMILRAAIRANGRARLILAAAISQRETLEALAAEDVDWSKVEVFHLDEYIDIPPTHPAYLGRILDEWFLSRVPIGRAWLIDGSGDYRASLARISEAFRSAPIDLCIAGIGQNGHLAFNDPPADFETRETFFVVDIDESSRRQQYGEGWFQKLEDVPTRAITMSLQAILSSRTILCAVPHAAKAAAVRATLGGSVSPTVPATILKTHPDSTVYLDGESASQTDSAVLGLYGA